MSERAPARASIASHEETPRAARREYAAPGHLLLINPRDVTETNGILFPLIFLFELKIAVGVLARYLSLLIF